MKKSILLIISISLATISFSQKDYKALINDVSVNFYDVCKSADTYFETHEKGKGSGWKGYQRWKNANEYKYYPSGDRSQVDPFFVKHAYEDFIQNTPKAQVKSSFNNGWKEIGPVEITNISGHYSAGIGRVEDHFVDPNNANIIYVGSRSGGFWRTTDGGANWQVTTDFLFASGVNTITASPTNSDSVLINVRNSINAISHGLYRSVDGGQNWVQSNFNPANVGNGGLGTNLKIYEIRYHPRVPNLVFIGTNEGIYRSDDNLATWTSLLTNGDIKEIHFHPTDDNIIYLYDSYYWGTNKNVVMRSTDQGLTYTQSNVVAGNNNNTSVHFSVSTQCEDCLYWASDNGLWISKDSGMNFTFRSNSTEGCGGFAVNDLDTTKMIYGYVDIDRSIDGGTTWIDATRWSLGSTNGAGAGHLNSFNTSTNYVHADLHPAKCVNGVFYVGTDGLFSKSTDNGLTWVNLSQGLGIRENYNLGVSQSNHYRSISGSQDNGTSIKLKDNWLEFYGADGMEGLIHPLNDDWIIGSLQYGSRRRTKNGGISQGGATPAGQSGSGKAAWVAPITYDPNNQMTIYNFSKYIYKSEDFGTTWDSIGKPASLIGSIQQSAIAENNSDIIVISRSRDIEKSIDGGITFVDIKNNLPNSTIQDIAFDPNDDNVIIVVYATYLSNGQKVYKTIDGGNNWIDITHNIGNMPVRSVVIDHTNASNIYIGAEIGVYTMPMNATNWVLYNTSLPNTSVEELEIVNGSNTIKAATWGRGMWEYSLVGRNDYPSILMTSITNQPTDFLPLENVDQFVTSVVSMENVPTTMYVKWSINSPIFNNTITMSNTADSTWKSDIAIPNQVFGTKVYFKVFAESNGNTTETYKFMYTVKEQKYCVSYGKMPSQGNVTLVNFGTINNPTGKTQPYTDYTASQSTEVYIGDAYNLTVNLNTDNDNYTYYSTAWIDWNQDFVFDANEKYELGTVTNNTNGSTSLSPFSIQVPANAIPGNTVMRVVSLWNSYQPNPCANGFDGEVEDYKLVVKQALVVPVLNYSFTDSTLCPNQNLSYSYVGDALDSLNWTFTNGTETYTSSSFTGTIATPNIGVYNITIEGFSNGGVSYVQVFNSAFSVNITDAVTLNETTCDANNAGTVVQNLTNTAGCDSIVTTITTLLASDNITINEVTCDANNVGTVVQNLTNTAGCDSIVTTITTLLASDNITINEVTCDANNVGSVVQNLTNTAGCDSIVTTITTLGETSGTITALGDVLTAHPSGLIYQWLDCSNNDIVIIGETNETYTATSNGDYSVIITDFDCSDTTDCYTLSSVGITKKDVNPFRIYPNPTTTSINIEFESIGNRDIRLTNNLGQTIKVYHVLDNNFIKIQLEELSNGIYYIHVESNNFTVTKKIIKQ